MIQCRNGICLGKGEVLLPIIVGFIFACVAPTGCTDSEEDRIVSKEEAIKIAINKAKELDYSIEDMRIRTTKKRNEIIVHFSLKDLTRTGAGLTITIDVSTRKIVKVDRWQ